MRVAALESIGYQQEVKPLVVHHAKTPKKKAPTEKATEEDLAKAVKEKQRKKALEKRKQQRKRNMQSSDSYGQLRILNDYKISNSSAMKGHGDRDLTDASQAAPESPKKTSEDTANRP